MRCLSHFINIEPLFKYLFTISQDVEIRYSNEEQDLTLSGPFIADSFAPSIHTAEQHVKQYIHKLFGYWNIRLVEVAEKTAHPLSIFTMYAYHN